MAFPPVDAAPADNTLIQEASIEDFQDKVLAASNTRPVLVDFWADWCGPCKQLMPALEQAVQAAGGQVALVKVNADQNQTLCAQLRVQSLPTVLAFFRGQPIDGFQGAIPLSQLTQFIDRLVQMAGQMGADLPQAQQDPVAEALAQAKEMSEAGDTETAAALYARILEVAPDTQAALLGLASLAKKAGDMDQVAELMETLDSDALEDDADKALAAQLKTALALRAEGTPGADIAALEAAIEADPLAHQTRFDLALAYQGQGNLTGAADALLGIVMRDRVWEDDKARKQLVKLFDAAGPTDPFTLTYRRRLSSVLFS